MSSLTATLPSAVLLGPNDDTNATGGALVLSWVAPLDAGNPSITSYAVFARSASRPWFLADRVAGDAGLSAAVKLLDANTAYTFFVLAETSALPIDLPGNVSITADSRVMRTTSNLLNWIAAGSVVSVQDSLFVVDNVTSASLSLTYIHASASLLNQRGKLLGRVSDYVVLNTTEPTLPDVPPAPMLAAATGGMLNVTVHSPADTGGVPVIDFTIVLNGTKLEKGTYDIATTSPNNLQLTANVSLPGLKLLTTYNVSAIAVNSYSLCYFGKNVVGPTALFQTGNISPPGSPQIDTYKTTGGGITLTLIDPHDTGGNNIQQYWLFYKQNGTSDDWKLVYQGASNLTIVGYLSPLTNYAFMAKVNNGYFTSVNSSVTFVKTTVKSPPGPCKPPVFKNATGGMLEVSWDIPPDSGGSNITMFYATIYPSVGNAETIATTDLSWKFYRLLAETSYNVAVQARNTFGIGPQSEMATFTTQTGSPPVGEISAIVMKTTGGAAEISFNEPMDLGGVTQTNVNYTIYLDQNAILTLTYAFLEQATYGNLNGTRRLMEATTRRLSGATTFANVIVGNMDPETLYGLQIRPTSSLASGDISSSFPVRTTIATAPNNPIALTVTSVTGGAVTLSWNPPVDSGGLPLDGYSVSMATSALGPFAEAYNDTQSSTTITNLQSSTSYWVYVVTWNDIGVSPSSEVVEFSTNTITPPSPLGRISISAVSDIAIVCTWGAPTDVGGDNIQDYQVTVTEVNNPSAVLSLTFATAPAELTGLVSSTTYSISVVAVNTRGDASSSSPTRYITTSSAQNIPTTPIVGCVSKESIQISWYPYPGIVTYRVLRDGVSIADSITDATLSDEGLSAGTTYMYAVQASVFGLNSPQITATTLDSSFASGYSDCRSDSSYIREVGYANNVEKQWRIDPMPPFSFITLTFSSFALECDHDYVAITCALTSQLLWKGGCVRSGPFLFQVTGPVILSFSSDASIANRGFELQYELDASPESTRIPPPATNTICSNHGRSQTDGSCKCSVGFTGEGCNNRVVCCSDPSHCYSTVCDLDPSRVIVVSQEFGDDTFGTGEMMNASETGTASKAVQTLARGIALSHAESVIFVYPGTYSGALNRDLKIPSVTLNITTLKGPFWTSVDCATISRFSSSEGAVFSVEGLSLANCTAVDGGVFKVSGGSLSVQNMLITASETTTNGGVLFATGSIITFQQVKITNSSAGSEGGAIYAEDTIISMLQSNVTNGTANRGGAVVLRGTSTLTGTETVFIENEAAESGGAIFSSGENSIEGVLVVHNHAVNGGGFATDSGSLQLGNCIVENNTAQTNGGGVALSGNTVSILSTTSLRRNVAGSGGGGMYVTGTANIEFTQSVPPSVLTENTAVNGAGAYLRTARVTTSGLNIENGIATEAGGGVAIIDSSVEWSDIRIQGNQAPLGGGAMIRNSQVTGLGPVTLTGNMASNGSAAWMSLSTVNGGNQTLCSSNTATQNGGAFFFEDSVVLEFVVLESNEAAQGGCIYANDAALKLSGIVSRNCSATEFGGALAVLNTNVTAKSVLLVSDHAADGGGIYVMSSSISGGMTIDKCSGKNHGGGMYVIGESSVEGVSVNNCSAQEGGATYVVGADLLIQNTLLSNSSATDKGGGLCAVNATIHMKKTDIIGDHSDSSGGGVFLSNSTVVHNSILVRSCDARFGGGINMESSNIVADNFSVSTITQNVATDSGGNILLAAGSSIESLLVSSGNASTGGGVSVGSGMNTISKLSVMNNTATDGGGIGVQSDSVSVVKDVAVSLNIALESGGGIHIDGGTILHDGMSVLTNIATSGAGISATASSRLIKRSTNSPDAILKANNATNLPTSGSCGGGLSVRAAGFLEANGLVIQDATAFYGAGVCIEGATLMLTDSLIQNGTATVGGGGIYVNLGSKLNTRNCSVVQNQALDFGGGLASEGDKFNGYNVIVLRDSTFLGNMAQNIGGGIELKLTNMSGTGNLLQENIALAGRGGAIAMLDKSSVLLTNWTLVNNSVGNQQATQGGSIYISAGASVTITNSTIASNTKAIKVANGGLIYIEDAASTMSIVGSLLEHGQSVLGGLIYSVNSRVYVINSTMHHGYAYEFGGGIFGISTFLIIADSRFDLNFAFYNGGGIYMKDGGTLNIRDTVFDFNLVEDGGGAIYLNPGAGVNFTSTTSNFTRNTNVGFGSALYIGRNNIARLVGCLIAGNGGPGSEGGAMYVVDANASVVDSLFADNIAVKGAAILITRSANLQVIRTTLQNNTALAQGGSVHASIRAIGIFTDSYFDDNTAPHGGAMFAMGVANLTLTGVTFRNNIAIVFGGAIAIKRSGSFTIEKCDFDGNTACTGGAISLQENGSFAITDSYFQLNRATDYGAGIFIDKDIGTDIPTVLCSTSRFGGNQAVAGDDIYWVYHAWFNFTCTNCSTMAGSDKVWISTSGTNVTAGWWPASVTSAVSVGVAVTQNSSNSTTSRNLAVASSSSSLAPSSSTTSDVITSNTPAYANRSLVKPDSTMLWPTLVVRDYYGAIATYDNVTRCQAITGNDPNESFSFSPINWISVDAGYIIFKDARVFSTPSDRPYMLSINCTLSEETVRTIVVDVTVNNCNPGYESINDRCIPCQKGSYSLDGEKCYYCPPGAMCEEKDQSGATTGVIVPQRLEGYYADRFRSSFAESNCDNSSTWSPNDPCKSIDEKNLSDRIRECSKLGGKFDKYWTYSRIYACLSKTELYECESYSACLAENLPVSTASAEFTDQCEFGYTGVKCATCVKEYYKRSNGSCTRCSDPNDPTVAQTTQILALVPMFTAVVALLVILSKFSDASESQVIRYAQAAKRFQVYHRQSRARVLLLAAKAKIQQRAHEMLHSAIERLTWKKEDKPYPFQIKPREVHAPSLRSEKFKIMLGFFQILGGFKNVYEIPWPDVVGHLMDMCSLAEFNFVDSTGIECFFQRDYFSDYRIAIYAVVGVITLVWLLVVWGVARYRAKLASLPRHCVKCGLPVFAMRLRKPPRMERRSTSIAQMKLERRMSLANTTKNKTSAGGARSKRWNNALGRIMSWRITKCFASALDRIKSCRIVKLITEAKRVSSNLWNGVLKRIRSLWITVIGHTNDILYRAKTWQVVQLYMRAERWLIRLPQIPAQLSIHEPGCRTSQRISGNVLEMVVNSNLRLWRARVWMRLYYKSYQNKCIKLFFWMLLLLYPVLSQHAIGSFYCEEIGEHFYMSLDRSTFCYEGIWLYYLPVSIIIIMVWVVGVPVLFWVILRRKRHRGVSDMLLLIEEDPRYSQLKQQMLLKMRLDNLIRGVAVDEETLKLEEKHFLVHYLYDKNLNEPSTVAQVGFIYHSYDTKFWWYEVWDLGRKLLLNCVVSLLAKAGANRIISGLVVLLVYLSVMLFYKPYRDRSDSALAGLTQVQLFITLFCGLILKMGSLHLTDHVIWLVTYVAIASNIGTISFGVVSLLREKEAGLQMARRRNRNEHRRAIAAHARKLWRSAIAFVLADVYLSNPESDRGPMSPQVMRELNRRLKQQRQRDDLNVQLELTSAMAPSFAPKQSAAASQVATVEER